MNFKKKLNPVVLSIVLSSVLISASLIFLGYQISRTGDAAPESPLDKYLEKAVADSANVDDPVLGDANAPVTIVEYSDYQCPFCRMYFLEAYPQIKAQYIDTGKAKVVFKDLPLDFHPDALMAANAATCLRAESDDETYFKYHDAIFEFQGSLENNTVRIPEQKLFDLAAELGVNSSTFKKCARSDKYYAEIAGDVLDGATYGFRGTPSFVINGTPMEGAQEFSVFAELIDNALKDAQTVRKVQPISNDLIIEESTK